MDKLRQGECVIVFDQNAPTASQSRGINPNPKQITSVSGSAYLSLVQTKEMFTFLSFIKTTKFSIK